MNNPKRRLFCLLMACCCLWVIPPRSAHATLTSAQNELDSLKDQSSEIDAARASLNAQLAEVADDKDRAVRQKLILEQEVNLILAQIENTIQQIAILDLQVLQKTAEVHDAEREENLLYEMFCQRVRMMEEEGEFSYWSILFEAASFSDLLDRISMIDEVMAYDNLMMDSLVVLREGIETERVEIQGLVDDQKAAQDLQEIAHQELQIQEKQVEKIIQEINAQEEQLTALRSELDSAGAAIDAAIRAKEAEIIAYWASQGGVGDVSSTGYLWPLPNYNSLSSLYGGRIHPITGASHNHSGIDIPAPSGTPILAAKSGIVITSVAHSAYGNYIVVSHGEGSSTLYAHMVRLGLPEGTIVQQGDVIGYVGTTGSSTGNHLHLEVRLNDARVDPINVYAGKALYIGGALIT